MSPIINSIKEILAVQMTHGVHTVKGFTEVEISSRNGKGIPTSAVEESARAK